MLDHQRGKAYPRSLEPLSLRDPSYMLTMTYGEMCRPADVGRRLWAHDKRPDYDDIRGQPDDEDRLRESSD